MGALARTTLARRTCPSIPNPLQALLGVGLRSLPSGAMPAGPGITQKPWESTNERNTQKELSSGTAPGKFKFASRVIDFGDLDCSDKGNGPRCSDSKFDSYAIHRFITTSISPPLSRTTDYLYTLFTMEIAELSTLPRELREEIWMLALLPDPGVYHFDPDGFTPTADMDGFEDERWMISKRKYPTAMHLCQESRRFSLHVMAQEQKQEQKDGILPYYCLGSGARPFNPTTDTFWFSEESLLTHPWVTHLGSVIGSRIHTIKNLALSSQCITIPAPGTNRPSTWNSFRWHRLGRFVSLRRVDVVLGETWVDGDGGCKNGGSNDDLTKVAELRLEKWTKGSSTTEMPDEVETMISKVRASVVEIFQDMFERMQENEKEELPLPEGAPGWQDGSEITFRPAQMVKVTTF